MKNDEKEKKKNIREDSGTLEKVFPLAIVK